MDIRESYDSAAEAYTEHLAGELAYKPLDRHLLNRFAEATRDRGQVADLGCGPGHVAKYLSDQGVRMVGVDLSPKMIACATHLAPEVAFKVGDVHTLDFEDGSLAGIIAFYLIVHFTPAELGPIFREMRRVLASDALALVSFHVGSGVIHKDDLFGARVNLAFRFHDQTTVLNAMETNGFAVIEHIQREPYAEEYPSRRCYLLGRATPRS